jgi:hypothetical protein
MSVHLKVHVDPDEFGLPGNRHHCAIANALMLADEDLIHVRVDEDNIRFSRRSTNSRFEYVTPANAAAFIREFDKLVAAVDGGGKVRKMTAQPFTLTLTDRDLIRETPRQTRNASYAIQRAAIKNYGPDLAPKLAAKTPTVPHARWALPMGSAKAPELLDTAPKARVARKRVNPAPRKRPSLRVA